MPDAMQVQLAVELMITTVFDVLRDTRIESAAERIAWGIVHSFHRVAGQFAGQSDRAAQEVRELLRSADGSEIHGVELEEQQQLLESLDEASDAIACMRDHAADIFHAETGRPWSAPKATLVFDATLALGDHEIVDRSELLAVAVAVESRLALRNRPAPLLAPSFLRLPSRPRER